MRRDLSQLAAQEFDLAVVGGGVHGARPEDEGRDIYDMALAIRDDASAALKGPEE